MQIEKIKKYGSVAANILVGLAFVFLIVPKIVSYFSNSLSNSKRSGEKIVTKSVVDIQGGSVELPLTGAAQAIIFWATWCGPCEAELAMYNKAIENKLLPAEKVLAVSIGEDLDLVKKTVFERGYKFRTFVDTEGELATVMQVQATPTTVLLNKEMRIVKFGVGISPLALVEAKSLLNSN